MKPLTAEWVAKAEGDWATTCREQRARRTPNHDAACFHAQQCAEKYLKALLVEDGIAFPKIHDLEALLRLNQTRHPQLLSVRKPLLALTNFAVDVRYPGSLATRLEARTARSDCRKVRTLGRQLLGLKS